MKSRNCDSSRLAQPELATAIDMQIDLLDAQRRVQARVPLPWIRPDTAWLTSQQAAGRAVVRFGDIPIEWTDFRLSLRQTADILHRYEVIDFERSTSRSSSWHTMETRSPPWSRRGIRRPRARRIRRQRRRSRRFRISTTYWRWPFGRSCRDRQKPSSRAWTFRAGSSATVRSVGGNLTSRRSRRAATGASSADAVRRNGPSAPTRARSAPTTTASQITSFATRDGQYRVYACDACRRYLKAYDSRNASRPVLVGVDTIATLPLDAAAMQRGYAG